MYKSRFWTKKGFKVRGVDLIEGVLFLSEVKNALLKNNYFPHAFHNTMMLFTVKPQNQGERRKKEDKIVFPYQHWGGGLEAE